MYITGVTLGVATTQVPTYVQIQILVAASIVASVLVPYGVSVGAAASVVTGYRPIFPPIPVANAQALTVKSASSVASAVAWGVSLECIAQSNVVDDGITVGTVALVNTLTTYTGNTPQTGDSFLVVKSGGTGDNAAIKTKTDFLPSATAGAAGGVQIAGANAATTYATLTSTGAFTVSGVANVSQTGDSFAVVKATGTGDNAAIKAKTDNLPALPASTTNITAGTVTTATNVTNVSAGGITAASHAAGALDAAALATDAAQEIADAVLDRANAIETGLTPRQALRLIAAANAGIVSGAATTTITLRNAVQDSKARITATVDADGNRSSILWDVT